MIEDLKALGEHLGKAPSTRDIDAASKKDQCASYFQYRRVFGSIRAAHEASGFKPGPPRRPDNGR